MDDKNLIIHLHCLYPRVHWQEARIRSQKLNPSLDVAFSCLNCQAEGILQNVRFKSIECYGRGEEESVTKKKKAVKVPGEDPGEPLMPH